MRSAQSPSPRFALRFATAAAHARLDALYSVLDLGAPDDYVRFLSAHAAALIPVEDCLVAAGADAVLPGWSSRRRGEALRADMSALGLPLPPPHVSPAFEGEDALLGGLYVIEGSRLGGAVLARSVGEGMPKAFLAGGTLAEWPAFVGLLDQRLISSAALDRATAAATAVFDVFEHCARAALEPTLSADRLRTCRPDQL